VSNWDARLQKALALLDLHYEQFQGVESLAIETDHPVPSDTRGWSQILISILTGVNGRKRKKGTDLVDGSDVKAALVWDAIDTPRFNGVLKAKTKATTAGKLESLDLTPRLFFVLWDNVANAGAARCRIWLVRPQVDPLFREMAANWFGATSSGNFQLHPPRKLTSETNVIRNDLGTFEYPLLFCAERSERSTSYSVVSFNPELLEIGLLSKPTVVEERLAAEEAELEEEEPSEDDADESDEGSP